MHKYTYEFLKDKTITSDLFSLSNIITDLKSKTDERKDLNKSVFLNWKQLLSKNPLKAVTLLKVFLRQSKELRRLLKITVSH